MDGVHYAGIPTPACRMRRIGLRGSVDAVDLQMPGDIFFTNVTTC